MPAKIYRNLDSSILPPQINKKSQKYKVSMPVWTGFYIWVDRLNFLCKNENVFAWKIITDSPTKNRI